MKERRSKCFTTKSYDTFSCQHRRHAAINTAHFDYLIAVTDGMTENHEQQNDITEKLHSVEQMLTKEHFTDNTKLRIFILYWSLIYLKNVVILLIQHLHST